MFIEGPVLLYGAGREARSTRRFLADVAPDAEVHVVVDKGEADIEDTTQIAVEDLEAGVEADTWPLIVRSAGVSIYKPVLERAKARGAAVSTNVNLWGDHRRGVSKVIAITGTKGKSTTAKLMHTVLEAAGLDAGLGGNIGVAPLDLGPHEWQVLELSSFQCADLAFDVEFAGVTSLFPEHLDWHGDETHYFADKLNLLNRKTPFAYAVSPQVAVHPAFGAASKANGSELPPLPAEVESRFAEAVGKSQLMGAHNLANARLAARIARAIGLSEEAILEGVRLFTPLPHRLQAVQFGGRTFVNDSIATNPEATKAAMAAFPDGKVALVVGGYDRGQNYDDLIARLPAAPLASLWLLPDTGHRIADGLQGKRMPFPVTRVDSLDDLFAKLRLAPDSFDTLILSPGAPSYNQFNNFEERGDRFLELAADQFGGP